MFGGFVGALVPEFEGVSSRGFVVVGGNPNADGLPGWMDGLEGFDVEWWFRWWGKADEGLPQAEEAEEKFDFLWADDGFDAPQGASTARALEGIGAPDTENEIAPQGAHGAGGGFGWGGEDFWGWFVWCGIFWWWWDDFGGGSGEAAGFVGVEAVVADGLLSLWRDVLDGGSEEVGGFEDFEVAFGVPTAAGAVDDGFDVGVPGHFLEGEGGAEEVFRETAAAFGVVGGDGGFSAGVDVEAAVFPA